MSKLSDVPTLEYFDTSPFGGFIGRGGAVRLFLIANGIQFEEKKVPFGEWMSLKASVSPLTGHLPIVHLSGKTLVESLATLRLLSKKIGQYGAQGQEDSDYQVDAIADLYTEWRSAIVASAFQSEAKESYVKEQRAGFYSLFERLIAYAEGSGGHVVGDKPSFADALVFSAIWDDVAAHKPDQALFAASPKLAGFYKGYLKQEAVASYLKSLRPDLLEAAAAS